MIWLTSPDVTAATNARWLTRRACSHVPEKASDSTTTVTPRSSMVRTPSAQGAALVAAAKALQARRTAHKDDGSLRVRVDPAVL